jgi:hypothetical protein
LIEPRSATIAGGETVELRLLLNLHPAGTAALPHDFSVELRFRFEVDGVDDAVTTAVPVKYSAVVRASSEDEP